MPLVSVIMSVYNGDKHLEESLSSIINQSFLDWELIVVNDFSKDNSGKIIQRAMQEDGRIRCIENKENLGLAASLNLAIEESSGQYIARREILCAKGVNGWLVPSLIIKFIKAKHLVVRRQHIITKKGRSRTLM